MNKNKVVVVAGAGGFIGGYLVKALLDRGFKVRAVDRKDFKDWYQYHNQADNCRLDLMKHEWCVGALDHADMVFNLAADMGGMGFIETHKAECMLSVLVNTHLLQAARYHQVRRFFYASSACVYNADKQTDYNVTALKESDAYPAMPEDGYGWEKLFSERMCRHFREDFLIQTRIARFHNVYGPMGTWDGGREKAPAAICRKVAQAVLSGKHEIEIWGTGEQTRSFTWIDDCIHGIQMIMDSDWVAPINLGSSELVSVNGLVSIVEEIAGVKLERRYLPNAPKGVNGRNSDNALIKQAFGWEPSTPLRVGMERTYWWVYDQLVQGSKSR